eukprot:gnl/Carplike_NY0171/4323_a5863_308.p1 GENE.gnl/Carplike_NY0171/4323_a5863_308~~gnl/Carplike_NY0171/4323_a5863_308.p1  ORF type:complete len:644 (+),score=162.51 gnl/Carplike_NY0171/4323_a5863_308:28-1959(+)
MASLQNVIMIIGVDSPDPIKDLCPSIYSFPFGNLQVVIASGSESIVNRLYERYHLMETKCPIVDPPRSSISTADTRTSNKPPLTPRIPDRIICHKMSVAEFEQMKDPVPGDRSVRCSDHIHLSRSGAPFTDLFNLAMDTDASKHPPIRLGRANAAGVRPARFIRFKRRIDYMLSLHLLNYFEQKDCVTPFLPTNVDTISPARRVFVNFPPTIPRYVPFHAILELLQQKAKIPLHLAVDSILYYRLGGPCSVNVIFDKPGTARSVLERSYRVLKDPCESIATRRAVRRYSSHHELSFFEHGKKPTNTICISFDSSGQLQHDDLNDKNLIPDLISVINEDREVMAHISPPKRVVCIKPGDFRAIFDSSRDPKYIQTHLDGCLVNGHRVQAWIGASARDVPEPADRDKEYDVYRYRHPELGGSSSSTSGHPPGNPEDEESSSSYSPDSSSSSPPPVSSHRSTRSSQRSSGGSVSTRRSRKDNSRRSGASSAKISRPTHSDPDDDSSSSDIIAAMKKHDGSRPRSTTDEKAAKFFGKTNESKYTDHSHGDESSSDSTHIPSGGGLYGKDDSSSDDTIYSKPISSKSKKAVQQTVLLEESPPKRSVSDRSHARNRSIGMEEIKMRGEFSDDNDDDESSYSDSSSVIGR